MVLGGITSIQAVAVTVSLQRKLVLLYNRCRADAMDLLVFSHLYSFSFEQNPNWTRLYPGQEEILVREL